MNNIQINNKTKITCQQVDYTFPAYNRVKMKDRETMYKFLGLARERKNLWNIKVTFTAIVVGALGTFLKNHDKRLDVLDD